MKKFLKFQRLLSFVIVLSVTLTAFTAISVNADEVKTSNYISFDDFTAIDDANFGAGGNYTLGDISLDDTVYRGASGKSIKMTGRDEYYDRLIVKNAFAGLDLTPGTQYVISAWIKLGEDAPKDYLYFFVGAVERVNGKNEYIGNKDMYRAAAKNDWAKVEYTYTVTGNPLVGVYIEQRNSDGVAPVVYVDDIEVVKKEGPERNHITFDGLVRIGAGGANVGIGGNYEYAGVENNVSLDSTIFRGESGKSLKVANRKNLTSRVKIWDAFEGLDLTPGTVCTISAWIRVHESSTATAGIFYIAVIEDEDVVASYYNNKDALSIGKRAEKGGGWVKIELPYTITEKGVMGIVIEQASGSTVQVINIDDVEVVINSNNVSVMDGVIAYLQEDSENINISIKSETAKNITAYLAVYDQVDNVMELKSVQTSPQQLVEDTQVDFSMPLSVLQEGQRAKLLIFENETMKPVTTPYNIQ